MTIKKFPFPQPVDGLFFITSWYNDESLDVEIKQIYYTTDD